jgi:hypothetical protein
MELPEWEIKDQIEEIRGQGIRGFVLVGGVPRVVCEVESGRQGT